MFLINFYLVTISISLFAKSYIQADKTTNEINHFIDPIVETANGNIRGFQSQTIEQNVTYYGFQGIPFAEPPVGQLRFEPPVPITPWNETLNATSQKDDCVQGFLLATGSEDCLYLNVYTPKLPCEDFQLLPVMVFIYGGAFIGGTTNYESYGPDYFLEQNVVFVSINYRLGIFGFGSTGDLVLPGNNGLKDQLLALKWIKANIAHFGGNNQQITIFGESAGSASVSYHLQSKQSKDLFQGAIMESGNSLCLWALSRQPMQTMLSVATSLAANTSSSQSIVNDLRKVDYAKLQTVSSSVYTQLLLTGNPKAGLIIGPVEEPEHENAFWTGKSHEAISRGEFHQVPTIMGFNSMEANADLSFPIRLYLLKYDFNLTAIPPIDMNLPTTTHQLAVGTIIKAHYWDFTTLFAAKDQKTLQYISDDQFVRPIREQALQFSKYAPVYLYRFGHEGPLGGIEDRPVPGVAHAEELNYLFVRNTTATETDKLVRSRMIKLWTNFAKYGDPTSSKGEDQDLLENVVWTPAQPDVNNLAYLDISDTLQVKINPEYENMKFWDYLYDVFGTPPYDTY